MLTLEKFENVDSGKAATWPSQGNPFLPTLLLCPILAFLSPRYLLPQSSITRITRSSITRITFQPTLAHRESQPDTPSAALAAVGTPSRGLLKNAPKLAVP